MKKKKPGGKQNSTEQRKNKFQALRNIQIPRVFKKTNFDRNRLYSLMTLVMSFVTVEKKTKTNENKTRNENKYEKNRASGKTGQKKDKLNIELFVMLNLRS